MVSLVVHEVARLAHSTGSMDIDCRDGYRLHRASGTETLRAEALTTPWRTLRHQDSRDGSPDESSARGPASRRILASRDSTDRWRQASYWPPISRQDADTSSLPPTHHGCVSSLLRGCKKLCHVLRAASADQVAPRRRVRRRTECPTTAGVGACGQEESPRDTAAIRPDGGCRSTALRETESRGCGRFPFPDGVTQTVRSRIEV